MSILENYKNKECKTKLGKYFQRLTFTWSYKIYTSVALILISSIAFNFIQEGTFLDNLMSALYMSGLVFMILLALVMIVYAFIINPINWLIEKYKKKPIK